MSSSKTNLKLYADECFPVTSVTYLKSLGFSIVHASDTHFVNKKDLLHLKKANKDGRTLITLDRDFLYYKESRINKTSGVIVVSVGTAVAISINKVCKKALSKISSHYASGSIITITNDKIIRIKNNKRDEKII